MPDVFVALDTTWSSSFYMNIARKGLQNNFCLKYVNKHRQSLIIDYPDLLSFDQYFEIDESIISEFLKFVKAEGIEYKIEDYKRSKKVIHAQIKALIARNIWGSNGYFFVINKVNDIFNKSFEIINSNLYNKIIEP